MRRHSNRYRLITGSLLCLLIAPALDVCAADPPELFTAAEPLLIRIEAPFSEVIRTRRDPQYERARLFYTNAEGTESAVDLRVRVRGKSRAALCSFPPLLLNFPNEGLAGTVFEGQNRLKLVTHCQASSDYEDYVELEYLAYRALALVTDTALAARLVEVRYVDSERGRELAVKPGILLEDEERYAERMSLTVVSAPTLERARYDQPGLALLETFQYFIGNTDWSVLAGPDGEQCCHNVVPYARTDGSLVGVPYDFDGAGLVNAPHALPDERLGLRTVRQRLYRGPCRSTEELQAAFARFAAVRPQLTALFTDNPRLEARRKNAARSYVDEFFGVLDDPARVTSAFRRNCAP